MSDDDLWRPSEDPPHAADEPTEPEPSVSDETQPITGTAPAPPPASPPHVSPSGPGAVPPPANPYGQATGQPDHGGHEQQPGPGRPGWNPYADPSAPYQQPVQAQQPTTPYPQGSYGPPGYLPPQNPYARPNEYSAPQSPYGSPYQPAYAGGLAQNHPTATTAMVLGIVGLASIAICAGVLLVVSPIAWILGGKAVKEIDASPGRYAGRDRAQAGRIMGIIGTVLLVLGVIAIVLVVVALAHSDPTIQPSYDQNF